MRSDIEDLLQKVVKASNQTHYYESEVNDACAPALKAATNANVSDDVLLKFLSETKKEPEPSAKIALTLLGNRKYDRKIAKALAEGNRHLSLEKYFRDTPQKETELKYIYDHALKNNAYSVLMFLGSDYSEHFDFEERAAIYDKCHNKVSNQDFNKKLKQEILEKYPTSESLAERIATTEKGNFRSLLQTTQKEEYLDRHWSFQEDKPAEASVRSYFDSVTISRHFNFNAETVTIVTSKDKSVSAETKFFSEFNSQAEIDMARENLTLFHGKAPNSEKKPEEKQKLRIAPIAPKALGGQNA